MALRSGQSRWWMLCIISQLGVHVGASSYRIHGSGAGDVAVEKT
jgi:hypothetical protein